MVWKYTGQIIGKKIKSPEATALALQEENLQALIIHHVAGSPLM
jgi:hypothetical protein